MLVTRLTNGLSGALLIVAALAFLVSLPANIADHAREPEDVWLGVFWIALLGSVGALCFTNAAHAAELPRWRFVANLAVITSGAGLLLVGPDDPAVAPLLALCVLGPLVALGAASRRPGRS